VPIGKRKTRVRRRRREALVHGHLENVSRDLLENHRDIVREFIGRNAGIYALYRKNRLYYVGLATALRGRLKAHGKNKHGQSWDRFSIYLTVKDQHLREIEALMLRIAHPPGAKQRGKLARSRDMRGRIARAIRERQSHEVASLFERRSRHGENGDDLPRKPEKRARSELVRLLPMGARLRASYNGTTYNARARPDGRVRYNGTYYSSLTWAAKGAIKRTVNGWWFWKVKRGGYWVRLTDIRKAGTPVYSR
jgi:hypothetical protein